MWVNICLDHHRRIESLSDSVQQYHILCRWSWFLHTDYKDTNFVPLNAGYGMLIHTKSRRTKKIWTYKKFCRTLILWNITESSPNSQLMYIKLAQTTIRWCAFSTSPRGKQRHKTCCRSLSIWQKNPSPYKSRRWV